MRPSAVDVHFLKHREAHTVVDVTGLCDFIGSTRFLFTELVAGETQHHQTLRGRALRGLLLWRESTMTGGINHQHQFASVIGHRDGLAIETGGSKLMKGGHTGILN